MPLLPLLMGVAGGGCSDLAHGSVPAGIVVPVPPQEPAVGIEELLALHDALVAEDFDRLDARLAWSLDSARHDTGYELRYRTLFGVFMSADSTLRPHLDAWVARRPRSAVARLARAAHADAMAGRARGAKWLRETSRQQIAGMRAWHVHARADLNAAHELDSTNVATYWIAMDVAMNGQPPPVDVGDVFRRRGFAPALVTWLLGADPAELPFRSRRRLLDAGLRQVPSSFILRWRYAYSLRPRWGGSYAELRIFADECDRAATLNPRLPVLRGFAAYDSAIVLAHDDEYDAAIAAFGRALAYGDHWLYRVGRADARRHAHRYEEARADYDSALAQHPGLEDVRALRGYLLSVAARDSGADSAELMRRARLDACIAAVLDPMDDQVAWVLNAAPELRPAFMAGPPMLSPLGPVPESPPPRGC